MKSHSQSSSERRHRRDGDDDDEESRQQRSRHREREGASRRDEPKRRRRDDDDDEPRPRSSHRSRRDESESGSENGASSSSSGSDSDSSSSSAKADPRVISLGSSAIDSSCYYSHSPEFRHWLANVYGPRRDSKRSSSSSSTRRSRSYTLDTVPSKTAHRLFSHRFVPEWNAGELSDDYYLGKMTSSSSSAPSSSSRRWKFTKARTEKEQDEVAAMRNVVDSMTNGTSRGAQEMRDLEARRFGGRGAPAATSVAPSASAGSSNRHHSDAQYDAEAARESSRRASQAARKVERRDAREREEESNPRATGREANVERRRERNAANRDFEEGRKGGGGEVEVSEETLMGTGGSFREAMAAQSRTTAKRDAKRAEREEEMGQRRTEYRAKEDATMDMFKAMAKERFG